jgi:septal ring factor EnvC (AmiA/AmiB activator)
VARNPDGKIYGIRYDAVNAMLLNEFLKEHKQVEEQGQTEAALVKQVAAQDRTNAGLAKKVASQEDEIATLTASLKEQAALLQKVSAQLQLGKSAPQVVSNNN